MDIPLDTHIVPAHPYNDSTPVMYTLQCSSYTGWRQSLYYPYEYTQTEATKIIVECSEIGVITYRAHPVGPKLTSNLSDKDGCTASMVYSFVTLDMGALELKCIKDFEQFSIGKGDMALKCWAPPLFPPYPNKTKELLVQAQKDIVAKHRLAEHKLKMSKHYDGQGRLIAAGDAQRDAPQRRKKCTTAGQYELFPSVTGQR